MSQVISLFDNQLPPPAVALMNRVQNLAVRISCEETFAVNVEFIGHGAPAVQVHRYVITVSRTNQANPLACNPILSCSIELKQSDATEQLKNVAVCLESLLEPTPDDAA
ncbi:hypothetical protein R84981_000953 [Carnimonas sp. R-84981]|uniref:hypothetical protein n=1 Tax=Carnimonas bestiolae TaxID=3402172 RepID=UPI003EDBD1B0